VPSHGLSDGRAMQRRHDLLPDGKLIDSSQFSMIAIWEKVKNWTEFIFMHFFLYALRTGKTLHGTPFSSIFGGKK
jgi:hypothetical protein